MARTMNLRASSALVGSFLLIAAWNAAEAKVLYSSSFEGTDGGWAANGPEWERGSPATSGLSGCSGGNTPPPGANSGAEVWGTSLDACYANSGETSTLSQTFDLTALTDPVIKWSQYHEIFTPFDAGLFKANDDTLFQIGTNAPIGWEDQSVSLAPYAEDMVTLTFEFFATTVVNDAGWYMDDIIIKDRESPDSNVPVPGTAGLFAFGILGLLWIRRISEKRYKI